MEKGIAVQSRQADEKRSYGYQDAESEQRRKATDEYATAYGEPVDPRTIARQPVSLSLRLRPAG